MADISRITLPNGDSYDLKAKNANALLSAAGRPTDADVDLTADDYMSRLTMMIAGSEMTNNKPPEDAHIMTFGWDASGYGAQLAIGHSQSDGARLYTRRSHGSNTWETDWAAVYDTKNPPSAADVGASPESIRITTVAALRDLINSMALYEIRFIFLYNSGTFTNSKLSSTTRGYICKTDANVSDIMGVNAVSGFVDIRVNNSNASFKAVYKATMSEI